MSAFSNGTEYESWRTAWCDTCTHDREFRDDKGPGCMLNLSALMGQTPPEWGRGPMWSTYCTLYEAEPIGGER